MPRAIASGYELQMRAAHRLRKKLTIYVILSGAKNLSWFVLRLLNRREILRSAQNDNMKHFSAAQSVVEIASFQFPREPNHIVRGDYLIIFQHGKGLVLELPEMKSCV
jgi:hypothetical protein